VPAKLLFVGDGPERSTAEELSRELGVFDCVRFVGKQDQIEDILSIADLFLLTSEYESFGLAALEAMAAGVPVISTDAGGLGEINIDGKTGFTCAVGDVAGMSQRAIELLTDESMLQRFREAAREQASAFDLSRILPVYEALYNKVIK
jgi:N-acetyl-alpha-D-glucosaminyl L-malate synthase BshA